MVSYALLWVLYNTIQYNTILYLPTLHLGVTRLFLRPWVMEWNGRCPALSDAWLHLTWRVNLNNCLAWIKILNDEFAQTFVIVDHIKNVISETSDLFRRNSFLNITDLLVGNRGEKFFARAEKQMISVRALHTHFGYGLHFCN